jgi:23S rRNA (cytidine1920-2'-O)/16S rRNA (cytidine1409-2'-O)-methyltransferase
MASRAGAKLASALEAFALSPAGLVCADLGCSTGGFTDCLLQRGAAKVYSVDTGYGVLAYKLRVDPRVVVMERTNVLHATPPEGGAGLVVCDLSWTVQRFAVPAALRWLATGDDARVITLIKPHYERSAQDPRARGILSDSEAEAIMRQTLEAMPSLGATVLNVAISPIRGSGGKHKEGNLEWSALLKRRET